MAVGGRPQGAPKGPTEEANAVVQLLRELTAGMGVRELAERYEGSKTLWGEYRSGTRLIPMTKLYGVIKDRVRDHRGRDMMLAKARRLHEAAVAAEAEAQPAPGVEAALRQAELDVEQMNRVISQLLAKIDALEQAAAASAAGAADGAGAPVDVQLEELRSRVTAAREIQLATRQAYADAQQGGRPAPEPAAEGEGDGGGGTSQTSEALVEGLARLHDQVARHQGVLRDDENPAGASHEPDAETSPRVVGPPPADELTDPAPAAPAKTSGEDHDQEGKSGDREGDGDGDGEGNGDRDEGAGTDTERRPLHVRLATPGALLGAAACVIGGIVIGLNHVAADKGADRSLRLPTTSPSSVTGPDLPVLPGLASPSPSVSAKPTPGAGEQAARTPSPSGGAAAPARKQPPGTLYTVSADRK